MQHFSGILSSFDKISLDETDSVKLMNRFDTKFMFHPNKLPSILKSLQTHYSILTINSLTIHPYESIYFDTPEFKLYLDHHNGKLNRYKLRYRKYFSNGKVYFEIKKKNNKGITNKKRIEVASLQTKLAEQEFYFLNKELKKFHQNFIYENKLLIKFNRIALVHKNLKERVSFDIGLSFSNNTSQIGYTNLVIAEIKNSKDEKSELLHEMKKNHIPENSISKYCLGITSLHANVKYNAFKEKLILINKIKNGIT